MLHCPQANRPASEQLPEAFSNSNGGCLRESGGSAELQEEKAWGYNPLGSSAVTEGLPPINIQTKIVSSSDRTFFKMDYMSPLVRMF